MTPSLKELEAALLNADKAGDSEAAKAIANDISVILAHDEAAPKQPVNLASEYVAKLPQLRAETYDENTPISSSLWNALKKGVAGIPAVVPFAVEGSANIADRLSSAITGKGNPRGFFDMPATGATANFARNLLGVDEEMKPPGPITRSLDVGAEFFGMGSPITAYTAKRAVKEASARAAKEATEYGVKGAAKTAADIFGRDTAQAGWAGSMATIGGDITEDMGYGQAPGFLIGSLAGGPLGTLVSKAISSGYKGARNLVTGSVSKDISSERASGAIKKAMDADPQYRKNIDDANSVSERIRALGGTAPEFTLAQGSRSPGIVSLTKADQVGNYDRAIGRQTEVDAAITAAKDAAFPAGGAMSAESIMFAANDVLEKRLLANLASQRALMGSLKSSPQQETGKALDKLRDEAQLIAKAKSGNNYDKVYRAADDAGIRENVDDAVGLVREISGKDANVAQNMPVVFRKILDEWSAAPATTTKPSLVLDRSGNPLTAGKEIPPTPKEVSFQQLHSFMKEASSEAARAVAAGRFQDAHYIEQLSRLLKSKVGKYEGEQYGNVSSLLNSANKFYKEQYVPAFREGVGGKIGSTVRFGERVPRSEISEKFLTPEGIDEFGLIYGSNPAAWEKLEDGVVGLFKQATAKEGSIEINIGAANTFLTRYGEALDKVPQIKSKLTNVKSAQEAILENNARIQASKRALDDGYLARVAKSENIDKLVDEALSSPHKLSRLISLGPKTGPSPVARSIIDRIPAAAKREKLSPYEYMMSNEMVLRPLFARFGKDHFDNAVTIARAEQLANITRPGVPTAKTTKTDDLLKEKVGITLGEPVAAIRNIQRGRTSFVQEGHVLVAKILSRMTGDQSSRVIHEALYNSKFAADLLRYSKTGVSSKGMDAHLIKIGVRPLLYQATNQGNGE